MLPAYIHHTPVAVHDFHRLPYILALQRIKRPLKKIPRIAKTRTAPYTAVRDRMVIHCRDQTLFVIPDLQMHIAFLHDLVKSLLTRIHTADRPPVTARKQRRDLLRFAQTPVAIPPAHKQAFLFCFIDGHIVHRRDGMPFPDSAFDMQRLPFSAIEIIRPPGDRPCRIWHMGSKGGDIEIKFQNMRRFRKPFLQITR